MYFVVSVIRDLDGHAMGFLSVDVNTMKRFSESYNHIIDALERGDEFYNIHIETVGGNKKIVAIDGNLKDFPAKSVNGEVMHNVFTLIKRDNNEIYIANALGELRKISVYGAIKYAKANKFGNAKYSGNETSEEITGRFIECNYQTGCSVDKRSREGYIKIYKNISKRKAKIVKRIMDGRRVMGYVVELEVEDTDKPVAVFNTRAEILAGTYQGLYDCNWKIVNSYTLEDGKMITGIDGLKLADLPSIRARDIMRR